MLKVCCLYFIQYLKIVQNIMKERHGSFFFLLSIDNLFGMGHALALKKHTIRLKIHDDRRQDLSLQSRVVQSANQ